jgi:hypothetical protein
MASCARIKPASKSASTLTGLGLGGGAEGEITAAQHERELLVLLARGHMRACRASGHAARRAERRCDDSENRLLGASHACRKTRPQDRAQTVWSCAVSTTCAGSATASAPRAEAHELIALGGRHLREACDGGDNVGRAADAPAGANNALRAVHDAAPGGELGGDPRVVSLDAALCIRHGNAQTRPRLTAPRRRSKAVATRPTRRRTHTSSANAGGR